MTYDLYIKTAIEVILTLINTNFLLEQDLTQDDQHEN